MDAQNWSQKVFGLTASSAFIGSAFYVFGWIAIRAEQNLIGADSTQALARDIGTEEFVRSWPLILISVSVMGAIAFALATILLARLNFMRRGLRSAGVQVVIGTVVAFLSFIVLLAFVGVEGVALAPPADALRSFVATVILAEEALLLRLCLLAMHVVVVASALYLAFRTAPGASGARISAPWIALMAVTAPLLLLAPRSYAYFVHKHELREASLSRKDPQTPPLQGWIVNREGGVDLLCLSDASAVTVPATIVRSIPADQIKSLDIGRPAQLLTILQGFGWYSRRISIGSDVTAVIAIACVALATLAVMTIRVYFYEDLDSGSSTHRDRWDADFRAADPTAGDAAAVCDKHHAAATGGTKAGSGVS